MSKQQAHSPSRSLFAAVILGAVVACGGAGKPPALVYVSDALPQTPQRARAPIGLYGALPEEMRAELAALHDEVALLVESPVFGSWLDGIEVVFAQPGRAPMSGRRMAAIYLGRYPTGDQYRWHPICYRYSSGGGSETARSGVSEEPACGQGEALLAVTTLREITIERARSKVVEAHACAVNTFAHEWAHAISTQEPSLVALVFTDDAHEKHATAIASYVVGAIAQCVYLQHHHDGRKFDVARCVEAVGTNMFDSTTCDAGWSAQFTKDAEAVVSCK